MVEFNMEKSLNGILNNIHIYLFKTFPHIPYTLIYLHPSSTFTCDRSFSPELRNQSILPGEKNNPKEFHMIEDINEKKPKLGFVFVDQSTSEK